MYFGFHKGRPIRPALTARVLRNAEACSGRSYRISNRRIGFQFVPDEGKYGGGDDFYFGLAKPWEVATLVFYDVDEIDRCKIAMSFLFHKIVCSDTETSPVMIR